MGLGDILNGVNPVPNITAVQEFINGLKASEQAEMYSHYEIHADRKQLELKYGSSVVFKASYMGMFSAPWTVTSIKEKDLLVKAIMEHYTPKEK
jgi:hypothetical protein